MGESNGGMAALAGHSAGPSCADAGWRALHERSGSPNRTEHVYFERAELARWVLSLKRGKATEEMRNIGALIITYTILGVPCHNYSTASP